MMEWIKENSFVSMIFTVAVIFIAILYVTDEKIEKYEQIQVVQGDNLWSLADHYRGKMSKEQWIASVKEENILYTDHLKTGQLITVPIEKNSVYIAQLNQHFDEAESVKVASEK